MKQVNWNGVSRSRVHGTGGPNSPGFLIRLSEPVFFVKSHGPPISSNNSVSQEFSHFDARFSSLDAMVTSCVWYDALVDTCPLIGLLTPPI